MVKLFVGQIPSDATEATLRPHFEPCGRVADVRVHRGFGGGKQPCAFVLFERVEDAIDQLRKQKRDELIKMRKAAEFEAKMKMAAT